MRVSVSLISYSSGLFTYLQEARVLVKVAGRATAYIIWLLSKFSVPIGVSSVGRQSSHTDTLCVHMPGCQVDKGEGVKQLTGVVGSAILVRTCMHMPA